MHKILSTPPELDTKTEEEEEEKAKKSDKIRSCFVFKMHNLYTGEEVIFFFNLTSKRIKVKFVKGD